MPGSQAGPARLICPEGNISMHRIGTHPRNWIGVIEDSAMSYRKPAHRPLLSSVKDVLADPRLRRPLGQLAAAGLGALPLAALANPTGGQVVGGSATINTPNANATVVNQTSQNAAINWQQFSVGANQYVQFIQPNSSAVVLN